MPQIASRRKLLMWASGALAFTALPKPPALAGLATVPVSPPRGASTIFDGLEILTNDLKVAFDEILDPQTGFGEGDGSLRQVLKQAIEGLNHCSCATVEAIG